MLGAQGEEQVGLGFEAVVGAVVDHGRQVGRGRKHRLEMVALRHERGSARQDARDEHQAAGADLLRVGGMRHGARGIDRAGADDDRERRP